MIIILTQCFPSRVGGIESLISNLSINLSKNEKVIVFADQHHLFYDEIFDNKFKDQLIIRRIGGIKFFRRRRKIKEVKRLIDSSEIKYIIGDTWKSLELGIEYFIEKNITTICLAHGNELITKNSHKLKRIKALMNKFSGIVANSLYTKRLIEELVLSKDKVKYVYPGAEDLRNLSKDEFMKIDGNPILITLSRLEKRKGHFIIIKAVKKLLDDFPNLRYIISGDGSEKNKLKKFVKDNELENNIIFTGNVNDNQKKYLLDKSDLMIMTTLDETKNRSIEGFGIAYIEAGFFGIPSIASNIGGTPEAVINEHTGIIINNFESIYESIKNLLQDKKKLYFLGKNAQKKSIELYNWEYTTKRYKQTFEEIDNLKIL